MSSFRLDRLATMYLARPFHRFLSGGDGQRIPILMYHSISEGSNGGGHPYFATETSRDVFAEHMQHLEREKYRVITLDEAVALLQSPQPDKKKCAVITFDDGFRDFYTEALPILREHGFRAHVYLPTAHIKQQFQTFSGRACMTWSEVREAHQAGVIFGSHTVNHPQLASIAPAEVESELRNSKITIEQELGAAVTSFAYPYAFPEQDRAFTKRLGEVLQQCGYQNGVCTVIGSTHTFNDRFFLKRLPANYWDDPAFFQAKLEGDYDWLRQPQYLKKAASYRPTREL